jgi:AcrR family transcriptional regulator
VFGETGIEAQAKPSEAARHTDPDQTRERIIAAAREIFAQKGKRGATTREIAERAGVNEATLFRHFGSKEALIVAMAQRYCTAHTERIRELMRTLSGRLDDDLFTIGRSLATLLAEVKDMVRWSLVEMDYVDSVLVQETWQPWAPIIEGLVSYLREKIERRDLQGDPYAMVRAFVGMIFAHVIGRERLHHDEPERKIDDYISMYVDIFLNGTRVARSKEQSDGNT